MLTVPAAPRFRMSSAPLIEAVVQINFPIVARLQTVEGIAPLQDALFDLFPYMNQQVNQEVSLMIGPAGPASPETSQSIVHVFTNDDGWALSVTVSSATLSVGPQYLGLQNFKQHFSGVCQALHDAARVRRCDRIGVRYLNIVELDGTSDEWASWFRPEIVGVAHPDLSGGRVSSSLTETRLQEEPSLNSDVEATLQGIIRHGIVPPGTVMKGVPPRPVTNRAYLFDMDTFIASTQPFDVDALVGQYESLHAEIEKVFHWAVTEDGRDHFGYEVVSE